MWNPKVLPFGTVRSCAPISRNLNIDYRHISFAIRARVYVDFFNIPYPRHNLTHESRSPCTHASYATGDIYTYTRLIYTQRVISRIFKILTDTDTVAFEQQCVRAFIGSTQNVTARCVSSSIFNSLAAEPQIAQNTPSCRQRTACRRVCVWCSVACRCPSAKCA